MAEGNSPPGRDDERERDLVAIRETYGRYQRAGRAAMWDQRNPGYRRLASERNAAIVDLTQRSVAGHIAAELLDVGCGTGQLEVLLHAKLPFIQMTGVDLIPARIDAAKSNAPWAAFRSGSADRLIEGDAAFDVVTALTLFSSLPSEALEEAIANEIERVLRPGGWLIWYDIRYGNPWNPAVHGLPRSRLRELFPGWTMELRALGVPPPIARRMGSLTPVLYPTLHALHPIRSHLVGRLMRPR